LNFGDSMMTKIEGTDLLEVIKRDKSDTGPILIIDTLDRGGARIVESDTLRSDLPFDWNHSYFDFSWNFRRDQNDNLIWFIHFWAQTDTDPDYVEIRQFLPDGVDTIILDLEDMPDLMNLNIFNVNDDEILFGINFDFDHRGFLILNRHSEEQQLIRHVHLFNSFTNESIYRDLFGRFLFGKARNDNQNYLSEIFEFDGNEMVTKATFRMVNRDYVASIDDIYPTGDGDYLVEIVYGEVGTFSLLGYHSALLRVTPEQLGLITDTEDVVDVTSESIDIYPNPFIDKVNITSNNFQGKVLVYDFVGGFVSTFDLDPFEERVVDLSDFSAGIYTISYVTDVGLRSKRVIKMK